MIYFGLVYFFGLGMLWGVSNANETIDIGGENENGKIQSSVVTRIHQKLWT